MSGLEMFPDFPHFVERGLLPRGDDRRAVCAEMQAANVERFTVFQAVSSILCPMKAPFGKRAPATKAAQSDPARLQLAEPAARHGGAITWSVERGEREPGHWLMFAFFFLMMAWFFWGGAERFWYPLPFLAYSSFQLLRNKQSGMVLTETSVIMYNGTWRKELRLANIVRVHVITWSEGPDDVYFVFHNDTKFWVPSDCFADWKDLITAFRARRVPAVEQGGTWPAAGPFLRTRTVS